MHSSSFCFSKEEPTNGTLHGPVGANNPRNRSQAESLFVLGLADSMPFRVEESRANLIDSISILIRESRLGLFTKQRWKQSWREFLNTEQSWKFCCLSKKAAPIPNEIHMEIREVFDAANNWHLKLESTNSLSELEVGV